MRLNPGNVLEKVLAQVSSVRKQWHVSPPTNSCSTEPSCNFISDGAGRNDLDQVNGGLQHGGVEAQYLVPVGGSAFGKEPDWKSVL